VGLEVTTQPLNSWDLRRANEIGIRWFARKDGALIQFSTELPRPLAPNIEKDAWKDWVVDGFKESIVGMKVVKAVREVVAGRPGWAFEFVGKIEGRDVRVVMKQFVSHPDRGSKTPRVVTLSLQAPIPADPDAGVDSHAEVVATFDAIDITVKKPWTPAEQDTPRKEGLLPRKDDSVEPAQ
jgi:hypothetical protein